MSCNLKIDLKIKINLLDKQNVQCDKRNQSQDLLNSFFSQVRIVSSCKTLFTEDKIKVLHKKEICAVMRGSVPVSHASDGTNSSNSGEASVGGTEADVKDSCDESVF